MKDYQKRKWVFSGIILWVAFAWCSAAGADLLSQDSTGKEKTGKAAIRKVTEWYQAVGTVRPKTETSIQAQVRAQINAVHVKSGTKVEEGELLITLDDRQFRSKFDQARQALKMAEAGKGQAEQGILAAKAEFSKAEANYNRIKTYFASQAATSQDLENAESAYLQAKAGLTRSEEALLAAKSGIRQAQEVIKEAEIALGYTKIKAPGGGEVLNRLVEVGDLALPGKPLIVLQTSGSLRLEAYVREGIIGNLSLGKALKVKIDTLNQVVDSTVDEIVPYADPKTRTFLVKTSLPDMKNLYPGMFGKLLIPVDEKDVVVVPKKAVREVGQLNILSVKKENGWKEQYVRLGRTLGEDVEVLSGLSGDEIIGWKE